MAHAVVRVEVVQRVDHRDAAAAQRVYQREVPGVDAGEVDRGRRARGWGWVDLTADNTVAKTRR